MNAGASDSVLELANSVEVTREDLFQVAEEGEGVPEGERSLEAGMFLVARLYRGDFRKATAVHFRMQALSNLLMSKAGLPGWTLPELPDGSTPTEESVFAAAAVQPLIEVGGKLSFEREAFMAKILEFAELETQG